MSIEPVDILQQISLVFRDLILQLFLDVAVVRHKGNEPCENMCDDIEIQHQELIQCLHKLYDSQ
jgi:hypothetical protein